MSVISTALIPPLPMTSSGLPNVISVPTTQVASISTKNYSILPLEILPYSAEVKETKTTDVGARAVGYISPFDNNKREFVYIIHDRAQLEAFVKDENLNRYGQVVV